MGKNSDLLAGTLDMLVLSSLRHGRMHGYGIARFLQQISDDFFQVEEGSLYPALQRLDLNGLIEGEWSVTPTNRRARFYRLTPAGLKRLQAETERYRNMTLAITKVLGTA
ncbi:PadR family transcriptional regulator [uncultured Paludibaculum sp.]|uniref:PadR family transcriptional regulator n=1 Tax=uncultured Paludibaculum sp. TaxID=1765020 RepID=UPI002AAABE96|nr:PadR family transcriptional regulator [uncultured Paludibaculum sp.]